MADVSHSQYLRTTKYHPTFPSIKTHSPSQRRANIDCFGRDSALTCLERQAQQKSPSSSSSTRKPRDGIGPFYGLRSEKCSYQAQQQKGNVAKAVARPGSASFRDDASSKTTKKQSKICATDKRKSKKLFLLPQRQRVSSLDLLASETSSVQLHAKARKKHCLKDVH